MEKNVRAVSEGAGRRILLAAAVLLTTGAGARTFDVTAYGAKPTAADIFRAVDGFEFINTRFSLHAKTAK